jgi:hypothetical protein
MKMRFIHDDGGRKVAGFEGRAGDCVCRAVAIASGRPYSEVYRVLAEGNATQRQSKHSRRKRSAGVRTASHGIWTQRKWLLAGSSARWGASELFSGVALGWIASYFRRANAAGLSIDRVRRRTGANQEDIMFNFFRRRPVTVAGDGLDIPPFLRRTRDHNGKVILPEWLRSNPGAHNATDQGGAEAGFFETTNVVRASGRARKRTRPTEASKGQRTFQAAARETRSLTYSRASRPPFVTLAKGVTIMAMSILDLCIALGETEDETGSMTADQFDKHGLPFFSSCQCCQASLGPYNAFPSRSGYIRCKDCDGDPGYSTLAEFEADNA